MHERPGSKKRAAPDNGLRAEFHKNLPMVHWQAIELGVIGSGVPDTNGCHSAVDFWIEMKSTDTYAVGLEPEQVGWTLRRLRAGGRTFVATRRAHAGGPKKGSAVDELHLHEGWDAPILRAEGLLAAPPLYVGSGGPSKWDWGLVLSVLVEWQLGRAPVAES